MTETIYALGKEKLLIGRSNYCNHPEAAKILTPFGTSLTPNLEALARTRPSVVLIDKAAGAAMKQLTQVANTTQLPWLTREDIRDSILKLGDIVGAPEKAAQLSLQIHQSLESKTSSTSQTMLVIMGGSNIEKGQIWFIRRDSIHGAAIQAAGFNNAAPKQFSGPPQMSLEQLLQLDPDVILFLPSTNVTQTEKEALIASLHVVPTLRAVKNKAIGVIMGSNLMGIGPTIPTLVERIREEGRVLLERDQ